MRVSSPEAFYDIILSHFILSFIVHVMTHFLLKAVTPTSSSCQEGGCELHGTIAGVAVVDLIKVLTKLGSHIIITLTHLQLLCYGLVWSVTNVGQNRVNLDCLTAT